MAEALSSCNILVLKKNWITQDPKSVAFTQLLSKAETIFQNHSSKDDKGGQETCLEIYLTKERRTNN